MFFFCEIEINGCLHFYSWKLLIVLFENLAGVGRNERGGICSSLRGLWDFRLNKNTTKLLSTLQFTILSHNLCEVLQKKKEGLES